MIDGELMQEIQEAAAKGKTSLHEEKVDSAERITKMEADNKRYKAELKFIRTGNDDDLKAALAQTEKEGE
jgi:hypothetical protein